MEAWKDAILVVAFAAWITCIVGIIYWAFSQAKTLYVTATERLHRRRIEMMDKLIELERVKTAASSVTEPSLKPGKEVSNAEPPN